jgi:hypothetical protein
MERRVIQASKALGGEFSYNVDMNSGDQLGVGTFVTFALQL